MSHRFIHRQIESKIRQLLARGKSILLLGPRQTGKTTLVEKLICPDLSYSFARLQTRQRYEKNPELLELELEDILKKREKEKLTIFIDEVQKIPNIMDAVQHFIDKRQAQFILSGSSARKLKQGHQLNWLPGRVVVVSMTPFLISELPKSLQNIEDILIYGTLPDIITSNSLEDREDDLLSYVRTYLEEEVRAEALVRNVGDFARFLEVAAGESGGQINFTRLSQDVGIADTTIASYYQILEDCLIASRVDPITNSHTKRRLVKSPKYLFFDMGVRRICANEGTQLSHSTVGRLFEHYIGNELIHQSQLVSSRTKVRYWRDLAGPEIDFVLEREGKYIPIEVKWTDSPKLSEAKHLKKFMDEHPNVSAAYVICRTPHRYQLADHIFAMPWQLLPKLFE
jgi:uncharacterized protein